MGYYLFFVDKINADGQPADNAKWLDTNVKTTYTCQFEQQARAHGLKYAYPENGARATLEQLQVYAQYLHLLKQLYAKDDAEFFEHEAMASFITQHEHEITGGQWYWHQG